MIIDQSAEIYITLETITQELTQTAQTQECCFWELNLYTGKLYWSDEICQLLGMTKPYTPTLEQLIRYYQPTENIRPAFNRAIHQGIPFKLELPSLTTSDKLVMVCTTASPIYDDYGKCIAIKGILQSEVQEESILKLHTFIADPDKDHHIIFENFARIVSHNLRSHTSNLQMVLESVNPKTSSKEMRDVIGSIKTISSNLNQTVGYLNTLTKI